MRGSLTLASRGERWLPALNHAWATTLIKTARYSTRIPADDPALESLDRLDHENFPTQLRSR